MPADLYWDQSVGDPEIQALLNILCLHLDRHFMLELTQGWWNFFDECLDSAKVKSPYIS